MQQCFSIRQALRKAVPVITLFFLALVLSGNSVLCAQEIGSISIRTFQKIEKTSPVVMADVSRKTDTARYAQENSSEKNKDAAPAKPDIRIVPQNSDEYGDVTPEELGIAPKVGKSSDEYGDVVSEEGTSVEGASEVNDPIRPFNTAMYHFNDKVYFWVWKPASTGYKYVVPEEVRGIIANFYDNLKAPLRILNNLFQGDAKHAGTEFLSLLINSTIGVGGLRNCSQECFGIQRDYADFGQTLGKWGFGYGFYVVLPFLGPSDVRDGIGLLFDWPMRPTSYVGTEFINVYNVGLYVHERINYTSFHIGEYEVLKSASVDPYIAMREAYIEYRNNLIRKP